MRKGAKGFHIPYSMGSQGAIKSFHMIVMNCSDFSGLSLKNQGIKYQHQFGFICMAVPSHSLTVDLQPYFFLIKKMLNIHSHQKFSCMGAGNPPRAQVTLGFHLLGGGACTLWSHALHLGEPCWLPFCVFWFWAVSPEILDPRY